MCIYVYISQKVAAYGQFVLVSNKEWAFWYTTLCVLCISMYSYIYGWAVLIIDIYDYHKRKEQSNAVIELSKKAWKMKEKENKKKETMFLYLFVCSSCIFHSLYCNTIFTQHFCYLQGVGYRGGFIRKCDYHSPPPTTPQQNEGKEKCQGKISELPASCLPNLASYQT